MDDAADQVEPVDDAADEPESDALVADLVADLSVELDAPESPFWAGEVVAVDEESPADEPDSLAVDVFDVDLPRLSVL